MDINTNILTRAGFIKIPLCSGNSMKDKVRLYSFLDHTSKSLLKTQEALQKQFKKGRIYEGHIERFDQDIKLNPYLLKTANSLKLISKEDVFQLQKNSSYSSDLLQEIENMEKDYIIQQSKVFGDQNQSISLRHKENNSSFLLIENLKNAISALEKGIIPEGFVEMKFQGPNPECSFIKSIAILAHLIGNTYDKLREYSRAIDYYTKGLEINIELKDQVEERIAYSNLGNAYHNLGKHHQAIKYHEKELKMAADVIDQVGESRAYTSLGNAYHDLGKYYQAVEYHKKCLDVGVKLRDQAIEGSAYSNLGSVYHSLGEHSRAINEHEKDLKISIEARDRFGEKRAYCNLGNAYYGLGEYHKAIEYYNKGLTIAIKCNNQIVAGRCYGNLGNAYHGLGEYSQAIEFHEKHLRIAKEHKVKIEERSIYNNLGNAYQGLGKHSQAIEYYEKRLKIALVDRDQLGEGIVYTNLGDAYCGLGKYDQAEAYFCKAIEIVAFLQRIAKNTQWQITLFEKWAESYIGLETILILQNKDREALEISNRRRSRVLSYLLLQTASLKENIEKDLDFIGFQKMQEFSEKLHTIFITYSLVPLNSGNKFIQAWIISSKREFFAISLPIPDNTFSELDRIFKIFPYQIGVNHPQRNKKGPNELFREKLAFWYDLLIAPLRQYLPSQDSGKTLTFIPDGFLAHLPFGAFYNQVKEKHLIEQYPISIAPSIQVLSLLDQLPKESAPQALLMGNPTTLQKEDHTLKESEREVRDVIAPLMKNLDVKTFTKDEAQVEKIFKHAPHAKCIHLACHGVAEQKPPNDPHSVFEGFFKLAPDEKYPLGQLHAKDVNELAITADLVFMSACHLGRGNLKKEGSLGPIWSFLGAGAKSTIASYWPLPEGDMTVKMVDTFYRHYLGFETPKLNKAKALQKAVLMAMETERNKPRQWGAFFLSGLIE